MTYDAWKTTPPDDRRYCPYCYSDLEDARRIDDERLVCHSCGRVLAECYSLSHGAMIREGRIDATCDDERDDR